MDLTSLLLLCITSLIIGAVLMLLIQYYVFVKFFNVPGLTDEQKSINEKYLLPDVSLFIFFFFSFSLIKIHYANFFFFKFLL